MARLLPTLAPPRPWYMLPRWGWVAILVLALGLTVANVLPHGEIPLEGNSRGPAVALCGFPVPAVKVILKHEGTQQTGDGIIRQIFPEGSPNEFAAGEYLVKPGAAEPVTFADGSTTRVYDAWALGLDIGVGVAALAAAYALCAWLAWRAARRR